MAIHWRYDEQDWKNEQCRRRPDFLICKDFDIMRDPERLSNEIENYLSSLEEEFDFIYIAAPPSESRVGKIIKVIWKWGKELGTISANQRRVFLHQPIKGKINPRRISWPIRFQYFTRQPITGNPPPRITSEAFAHPSSELTLIEGVGKSFARKGLIPIVSQVEMSKLMRAEVQAQCGDESFESLKFEILSMLDSEICAVAPVFYYSIMSSYSMNIQQERIVRTKGVTRFVS